MKMTGIKRVSLFTTSGLALAAASLLAGCGGIFVPSDIAGPGPQLSYTEASFDGAMVCTPANPQPATPLNPVLLVHGTGLSASESWSGNYATVLPALGYDTCTVQLPVRALLDIQVASEYVVGAIRRMNLRSGRRVNVLTHSQGGLEMRWALKYWPDIAGRVDDFVSLAAPNHGTPTANVICLQTVAACTPAIQQQRQGSNFLATLNANESVPAGISYTSIYSLADEIVTTLPPDYSPAVEGATNILVQEVCPVALVTHLQELTNGTVYDLVLDAFQHDGPASAARINPATSCLSLIAPGITPNAFLAANGTSYVAALLAVATGLGAPEPAIAGYAANP